MLNGCLDHGSDVVHEILVVNTALRSILLPYLGALYLVETLTRGLWFINYIVKPNSVQKSRVIEVMATARTIRICFQQTTYVVHVVIVASWLAIQFDHRVLP